MLFTVQIDLFIDFLKLFLIEKGYLLVMTLLVLPLYFDHLSLKKPS